MQLWFLIIVYLSHTSSQYLGTNSSLPFGICQNVFCNNIETLAKMKDCVVVVGNLRIVLLETATKESYKGISLPNLREVTGFVVVYRLNALESLSSLFPNLARIRGQELLNNYALIIHDMSDLRNIGLYNLIKIDRGGVTVWGGSRTCYVKSIDWNSIAPNSRLTLTSQDIKAHCEFLESCECGNQTSNYCWNSENCQKFFKDGDCHPECLGCIDGDYNNCLVCKNFTNRGKCVSQCPANTIVLPSNQYCLIRDECKKFNGWAWNGTCVMECPIGYTKRYVGEIITCQKNLMRSYYKKVCPGMDIHSLNGIQMTEKCSFINGSLQIHVRSVPGAMEEMMKYLSRIEEVTDYIEIYGSVTITSLEFLPKLRRIRGNRQIKGGYSLMVYNMINLERLFTRNVTENLIVDRGKLKMYGNPKLCMNIIDEIHGKFPTASNESDIPIGMNGYSGACLEKDLNFSVKAIGDSAALVRFTKLPSNDVTYTVLYAEGINNNKNLVPERCNDAKWFAIQAGNSSNLFREKVFIRNLRPATTYLVCIEVHVQSDNVFEALLARSDLKYFTTSFTVPEPPFVSELIATSPHTVFIKWRDHNNYQQHIVYHELEIELIEIPSKDLKARDHCDNTIQHFHLEETDYSPHSIIRKLPANYVECERHCETITTKFDDFFDVCDTLDEDCNRLEKSLQKNSSFDKYIKTLSLKISAPKEEFKVEGLAPYRDYRIRLRSCVDKCSRFTRDVIKTLRSKEADVPKITQYDVHETGHVMIKWEPPDITNGPVLKYSVQILPLLNDDNENTTSYMPHLLCVQFDTLQMTVRSIVAKKINVSVCSTTLGSSLVCSDWKTATQQSSSTIKTEVLCSVVFSIFLICFSVFVGYIYQRRRLRDDEDFLLMDFNSSYRLESEPPRASLTDFVPFYAVPLTESLLDYD